MARKGFTLVELLIVIVIICLLAALLIPAVTKALIAAKETQAAQLIASLDACAKQYERDYNTFPPTAPDASTGPMAYAIGKDTAKRPAYFSFSPDDVTSWPLATGSKIRNPVDIQKIVSYADNTLSGGPVVPDGKRHNMYRVDICCDNWEGKPPCAINNWGSR